MSAAGSDSTGGHEEDVTQLHAPSSDGAVAPLAVIDAPLGEDRLALIAAMRARVADVPMDDADREYWMSDAGLNRFLVARKLMLEDAVHMFTETMAFRRKMHCSALLAEYKEPLAMKHFFPWGVVGTDREGFPILVERIGAIDLIGMHATIGTQDFLEWVCWYHEVQERLMRRWSETYGRNRHKMTCIIDMKGVSLRHLSSGTLDVLKQRTRLEEDNYPEVARRVFLINTPSMFATVWGIVKHFMDEGTANKLQILGSNYLPTLLKYIDADNLPKFLGGNLGDSTDDVECRMLIGPGGMVPTSYLNGIALDGNGRGAEVHIHSGKKSTLLLHVPAGATVNWNWATVAKDVSFTVAAQAVTSSTAVPAGATHVTAPIYGVNQLPAPAGTPEPARIGGEVTQVVHMDKVHSAKGSYVAPAATPALVWLTWDNSYSWMSSKTLDVRVDVLGFSDAAPVREEDKLEAWAVARMQRMSNFHARPGVGARAASSGGSSAAAAS